MIFSKKNLAFGSQSYKIQECKIISSQKVFWLFTDSVSE